MVAVVAAGVCCVRRRRRRHREEVAKHAAALQPAPGSAPGLPLLAHGAALAKAEAADSAGDLCAASAFGRGAAGDDFTGDTAKESFRLQVRCVLHAACWAGAAALVAALEGRREAGVLPGMTWNEGCVRGGKGSVGGYACSTCLAGCMHGAGSCVLHGRPSVGEVCCLHLEAALTGASHTSGMGSQCERDFLWWLCVARESDWIST